MPTPLTRRALVALLALAGPAARSAEPPGKDFETYSRTRLQRVAR
ncbi:MAG TPA: hypothetical protein VM845_00050 [Burkholderiaceae bacterium]|jgi:hypothetical protein|nr:hypothetical protein [Burkholderiaceae bacterium]